MRRRFLSTRTGIRLDLAIVAALLALIAIPIWSGTVSILPSAVAQIPDTGLQRKQLIDEQRRTNELLEQILDTLQSRTIKVYVATSDKEGGASPRGSVR